MCVCVCVFVLTFIAFQSCCLNFNSKQSGNRAGIVRLQGIQLGLFLHFVMHVVISLPEGVAVCLFGVRCIVMCFLDNPIENMSNIRVVGCLGIIKTRCKNYTQNYCVSVLFF